MLKLPSLQTLWQSIVKIVLRFPIQVFLAITSTLIWLLLIYQYYSDYNNLLCKLLYVSNFGLTLLLATDLFCESHHYNKLKKWIFRFIVLAICTSLFFLLDPWIRLIDLYRILLLGFAFHLLVAFAPFINKNDLNGFWEYNKTLFIRFLTSSFYAGILFAGLAVALLAIDNLFNVNINDKTYQSLLALVSIGFTTIFFLTGIPTNFDALNEEQTYPKGLKIFTQYVLIPLMSIYLVILLIYEAKITIEWQLPKGLVSILILGYAVFGILSLLLVYPIRNKENNKWIKLFSKFFYLMMIPLIVLLFLAILIRVGFYGITESRYILIVLALWLSFFSIYFLISKKQNIKIIPISLCILALLATYGPQSAFTVSKYSQINRLTNLLKTNKTTLFKDEPSEIIRYLVKNHGLSSLQRLTAVNLNMVENKIHKRNYSEWEANEHLIDTAFTILKIKDTDNTYDETVYLTITDDNGGVIDVRGYDAVFYTDGYFTELTKRFDNTDFKIQKASSINEFKFTIGTGKTFVFDLNSLMKNIYNQYKINKLKKGVDKYSYLYPARQMKFNYTAENYSITLNVGSIDFSRYPSEEFGLSSMRAYILIKKLN